MKIVFLDIDGVLQPYGSLKRFGCMHEIDTLARRLTREHPAYDYLSIVGNGYCGDFDVAAVYYDWDILSVVRLRRLLQTTGARIVLTSDWREKGMEMMRALLAIHRLDEFLIDATYHPAYPLRRAIEAGLVSPDGRAEELAAETAKNADGIAAMSQILACLRRHHAEAEAPADNGEVTERAAEVREYLDRHPEVTAYVAFDDRNIARGLTGHLVRTANHLSLENYAHALAVLNNEDGPYPLPADVNRRLVETWRGRHFKAGA